MSALVLILRDALPALYAGLVFYFGRTFFRPVDTARRLKYGLPAAYVVIAIHALYIGAYTATEHHELLATIYELMSLIAFTLLAVYVFAELRLSRETSGTGFFVTAVAFLLQLASSLTIGSESVPELKPLLKNPIFNLHVTTSVFGYAALILAAIYGSLYLLLDRALRRNEYGALFEHIPSLSRLERYGTRATAAGFIFLT
ncbi:MAG: cytochrome c biogenesis protein CcsA, partial [Bacteroidota bacterium]|nr:cytochrome c biogenesis protein CcsA [Bacteroidota bacterium]